MPAEPERFAALFEKPSLEAMHTLSPREFERFVAYVLRRAGYIVTEVGPHFLHGVDLEVRRPGTPEIFAGIECKRFAPERLVPAAVVRGVRGAPAVDNADTRPIVITTSDFHKEAHQMAAAGQRPVYLINGTQFVRYIRYVRGSRRDDDDIITSLSPEFFAGLDNPDEASQGTATILTIANNKGGVGKTTTAYYLGTELARIGERVLLIDLDGQANLTEWCFPEQSLAYMDGAEIFPNIAQYISGERPLHDLVKETHQERLSIIPSDPHLTLRDVGGRGALILRHAFDGMFDC
jgi:AAA domain/Restriction endonuclease